LEIFKTKLNDCVVIKPDLYKDTRGFFYETFHSSRYDKDAGIKYEFVQDNFSRSSKNVLRGLHYQKNKPQGKLVRVVKGEIFDVAVDLRKNSSTFGKWDFQLLSEDNKKQFWIPPGFAHGFYVQSDIADVEYKCTDYYDSSDEGSILWSDPSLKISWPTKNPILSDKDLNAPLYSQLDL